MTDQVPKVPPALRRWFVVHFAVDIAFAVPLFVAPEPTLALFGWPIVDPVSARMVAAALFAIGTESLLMRESGVEAFRTMPDLKCIWSAAALFVIGLRFGLRLARLKAIITEGSTPSLSRRIHPAYGGVAMRPGTVSSTPRRRPFAR